MEKIKKTVKIIICILIAFVLVRSVIPRLWPSPLRRPVEQIREDVLELTPIGMSKEDVIAVIEGHRRWSVRHISDRWGFGMDRWGPSDSLSSGNVIGEQSIRAHLGWYMGVWRADVSAWWGFCADGKLIDVAIRKDFDSL